MTIRHNYRRAYIVIFFLTSLISWQPIVSHAAVETISVPFEALQPGQNGVIRSNPLAEYLSVLLQQELEKADLLFQGNGISKSVSTAEMTGGNCAAKVYVSPSNAELFLLNSSSINLTLDGIKDINLSIKLNGNVSLAAPSTVNYGADIAGRCRTYATDSGTLSARANFEIEFVLSVQLKPSYDRSNDQILINKFAEVSSRTQINNVDIDGDFGGLNITGLLVEALENKIIDNFTQKSEQLINDIVSKTNNRLNGMDEFGQFNELYLPAFNGDSVFQLPTDIQNPTFARQLLSYLNIPEVLFDTLDNKPGEILYIMLALEGEPQKQALAQLGSAILCDAIVRKFDKALPYNPIYSKSSGQCSTADPYGSDADVYFSDAQCSQNVAFTPGNREAFCKSYGAGSKSVLGNAATWDAELDQVNDRLPDVKTQVWTTTLATRLDIGVLSKAELLNPFLKVVRYKKLSTSFGNGVCELEMRIYKPSINATNLRPVMALHGGTWTSRGFSFLGLESTVPFLLDKGHIVFVPSYRLAGDKDANPECHHAGWRDILSDVQDALNWINLNGGALGSNDAPVKLFGQSAGAHLAIWLANMNSENVGRVLAFYPPLDTLDFFVNANTEYQAFANFGKTAFLRLYGANSGLTEINSDAIDFTGLDVRSPPESLSYLMPDSIFDFSGINLDTLPAYLRYCAKTLQIDVSTLDLLQPSNELLSCIKQDFSEFILSTSFIHKILTNPKPITIIQGAQDTLVPVTQVIKLCEWLTPNDGSVILDQSSGLTEKVCGDSLDIKIIPQAGHMLDLGICIGDVCPAGAIASISRMQIIKALENGFDTFTQEVDTKSQSSFSTAAGGAGHVWLELLLLIFFGLNRKIRTLPYSSFLRLDVDIKRKQS